MEDMKIDLILVGAILMSGLAMAVTNILAIPFGFNGTLGVVSQAFALVFVCAAVIELGCCLVRELSR